MLGQHVLVGDGVVLHRVRDLRGVGVVHAVDVFRQQDNVRVDLRRAEHRRGIRGEKRRADAAAEDDHAALLKVPDGAGADIRLRDLLNFQRGLDAHVHALLLQHVGDRHAVHRRGEHPHVVGAGALDIALAVLHAAPEVAAADDDAHLYAGLHALLDDVRHLTDDAEVQAKVLVARERLAADLEQDAPIFRFLHVCLFLPANGSYFNSYIVAYFFRFA